jgi:lipoprotein-anchoring transpeptidase ErfK/SrfK
MQRSLIVALLLSAVGSLPAFAESVPPGAYYPRQQAQRVAASSYYGTQAGASAGNVSAPAPASNLGGGFIEFLFTGGDARSRHQPQPAQPAMQPMSDVEPAYVLEPYPIYRAEPAQPALDPRFMRQTVPYRGEEKPGTIVINTPERLLYLVEDNGQAVRYGIGVGRPGFTWAGMHEVTAKREWPDWRPPDEMLKRRPDLPRYMEGGPDNPLGARALYLGSTLYRIHGSNEPWTIGQQVSSGCIRMRNEDVVDLYERVKVGAKVIVI